jgi:hypothetical protein
LAFGVVTQARSIYSGSLRGLQGVRGFNGIGNTRCAGVAERPAGVESY